MEHLINKRHSVRKFKEAKISDEKIRELLYLSYKAPSAGGLRAYQPYTFIDKLDIEKIAEIAHQSWITQASLVIIICIDPEKSAKRYGERGRNLYCIQDATIFESYLDLLFVEAGYGTCWVGSFNEKKIQEYFKISSHLRPINLLVIGVKDG